MTSLLADLKVTTMANITIRGVDEQTKHLLRVRAAHRHRSMEEEARQILRAAVREPDPGDRDLAGRIRERFAPLGGVDLQIPAREPAREPPVLRPAGRSR
jgi:plasmid stability protein